LAFQLVVTHIMLIATPLVLASLACAAVNPPTPPQTGVRTLLTGVVDDLKHLRSHSALVNDVYAPAKYFGDTPEQVALSLATYAYGRLFDEPKVSHIGMDLLRAQILTEIMVEPLKFATHRQRPDQSNYQSFPSGQAASASS
jgi:hypothetical protein